MTVLGPTPHKRLNEAAGIVSLVGALFLTAALVSYTPLDASLDTATDAVKAINLTGRWGAYVSDILIQAMGLAAFTVPILMVVLAWKWLRSTPIRAPFGRLAGAFVFVSSSCAAFGMLQNWNPVARSQPAGGVLGVLLAGSLLNALNTLGATLAILACFVVSLYALTSFELVWIKNATSLPTALVSNAATRISDWLAERREASRQKRAEKLAASKEAVKASAAEAKEAARAAAAEAKEARAKRSRRTDNPDDAVATPMGAYASEIEREADAPPPIVDPLAALHAATSPSRSAQTPPWEVAETDIPIKQLEPEPDPMPATAQVRTYEQPRRQRTSFELPSTELLQEAPARNPYDSVELQDTASRIKSKFEEFNVLGSVVQINPGPVVTTFEFKPEAGVKYSRITNLTEDLCLGLQAESILIERIPGKPTVGLEVPNTKREVISLRQILESSEFDQSGSPLTVAMGKDINGRIKVAALDTMPHLLIAGSTGSGKSVMLNSLIMSILYKATPQQVRMIMVDPKRLEFGPYEGIPHLLTPVITDAKKATNALKNAVIEMERRLKLLAAQGVRNIEQYNKKVRQLQNEPRSLFDGDGEFEELEPIPYVLILIDELADLMMLERANVEESVTRLAQMARAVGMHLVLATQRPSVDVITGLIKANFPSRISFRVATRVDSRTVLDVMGAEHLLGKGDMLFLPPGSSRLVRVHGSYVSEAETSRVVEFWKQQAEPDYDKTFLMAPPTEEEDAAEEFDGPEDPVYEEAVRVVLELGKASTSTLQRRLRLGYGRAARILDMMQREGIIGPPDGSRPRDVLKAPDWLREVDEQLR